MSIQLFGTLRSEHATSTCMLCIDGDRIREPAFYWCNHASQEQGALVLSTRKQADSLLMDPVRLLSANSSGGLYAPHLDGPQTEKLRGLHAIATGAQGRISGEWRTESGLIARFEVQEFSLSEPIEAEQCKTWGEFKGWVAKARKDLNVVSFRGHGNRDFALQTSLARAGRRRLERYIADELVEFRNHAEAVLGAQFDLSNSNHFSTVLGLAQHHGFPTPLLDWTGSPYIAAFFAFADALENKASRAHATHVRVYAMTEAFVAQSAFPVIQLATAYPYVAWLTVSALHNPRLYAQRGQFLVTNVANLEHHIRAMEAAAGRRYLYAADVPISEAAEALKDLEFMGLTAASLFPGLDGVGRMLRHQMAFR